MLVVVLGQPPDYRSCCGLRMRLSRTKAALRGALEAIRRSVAGFRGDDRMFARETAQARDQDLREDPASSA